MDLPEPLARRAASAADGTVWLAHVAGGDRVCLVGKVDEPITPAVDELYLRHLVDLICRFGLPGVVVAVTRRDGRVQRVDRRLGQELATRLASTPTHLRAVFVVGESARRAVLTTGPQAVDRGHPRHPPGPRGAERPSA